MRTIETQPLANSLIQSLRNIGYRPQTAIADLIDNSLDAGATEIRLNFEYNGGNGIISICDNGSGMDEAYLQNAMTIGSKDPRLARKEKELGRYGMGLKTASFSLGKVLSVLTMKKGKVSQRSWNLDYVSEVNAWKLHMQVPEELQGFQQQLKGNSGTIVIINELDRFCGFGEKQVIKLASFNSKVRKIQRYLEMVYHVLLENGLVITINDQKLNPWNPFLEGNERRYEGESQIIRYNGKRIRVTPFVLPHPSTFNKQDYEKAAGTKGWRDQQGFYIYREQRLVNFGEWFNLFPKDVASQLVRIKVEFGNDSDIDWKIDIKKSFVAVPDEIKDKLREIAKYYRQISQNIMIQRDSIGKQGERTKGSLNTWVIRDTEHGSRYMLNRTHPILEKILNNLDTSTRKLLNSYLKSIEIGSPNNLLDTSQMVKNEDEAIDDSLKKLIISYGEFAKESSNPPFIDRLAEAISMTTGFEAASVKAIKQILIKEVNY
ncbi:ATP-binding protein [Lysinibacillus fusiformis]|uniref:ATP-binding protein n=1 Tax=Lysinibacillus fusiformis TaxID=28031 RepID=UPI000D3B7F8E|nr:MULTISPECIES: ATP-binding protein [Lysinibacillus]MED4668992.1 ATP-binding protein [Lysinibacillus fusiformis]QAS57263.1 ATP-binding protein [Lysinibacillus sphaericus]RDV24968.1 ATP-binding protein [Lysinibacillus fusiformis]GED63291.1 ATPase [Lysinibacillus fusiformis]